MYSRWSDVITLVICFFVFCFLFFGDGWGAAAYMTCCARIRSDGSFDCEFLSLVSLSVISMESFLSVSRVMVRTSHVFPSMPTSCSRCHMSLFLIVRRLALFLNVLRLPRSCAFFVSGSKFICSLSSRARKRGGEMKGGGGNTASSSRSSPTYYLP